jgi:hypothetical protein
VQIDYREAEEDFLPFYPQMQDARRVSDKEEEIVCVPIHHFYASRQEFIKTLAAFAKSRILSNGQSKAQEKYAAEEWSEKRHASRVVRVYEKAIAPALTGWYLTADLSRLSLPLMREMIRSIRRRAQRSALPQVPAIISNHSKDIKDFGVVERFISEMAEAEDLRFITQTELVKMLEAGEFPIKKS